ncbi:putative secreted protein [Propionispora sp. 2/2-37]|nr:putative secreted protein [Propionispora sp. 2/2-37]
MKTNIAICLFVIVVNVFSGNICKAAEAPPEITAKSAIVIEAMTGKVLYAKDAEERRYPASTTKIMTLITALEYGKMDDIVTASENAANTEGSSLWLSKGETLTMRDMLYGIMLVSGNDATVSVAEHISGSVDEFAKLMTEKAHLIGAVSTNFTNSSGLPDPNHYSTAHDLARIAAYGYKNDEFRKIVSTKNIIIPWPGKEHDRDLYNENRLLWLYDGANGVKTGYTDAAGRCLVSGAQRHGIQLVAVVLDSERMWDDSMVLLDYGFKQVRLMTVFRKGDILKTVAVSNGEAKSVQLMTSADINIPVTEEEKNQIHTVIDVESKVEAPLDSGQKLGVVRIYYKDKEIAAADLVAVEAVAHKSFFTKVWSSLWNIFTFVLHNFA